jgi:hypothetical protein
MMFLPPPRYLIELDGETFALTGRHLERLAADDLSRDHILITDLQEAQTAVQSVDAEKGFAEIVVRKALQESGDFDEAVTIFSHWKKAEGNNRTRLLYSAMPTLAADVYKERAAQRTANCLTIPLYTVLLHRLKRSWHLEPTAVIFQHGRFADILVGAERKVLFADRIVAFDASPEQIEQLWQTLRSELDALEAERSTSITRYVLLDWIDSRWPEKLPFSADSSIERPAARKVDLEGTPVWSSFLDAVRKVPRSEGIEPFLPHLGYGARRVLPYLNLVFFLLALVIAGGTYHYHHQAARLGAAAAALEKQISNVVYTVPESQQGGYRETLALFKELSFCAGAPPFHQVLNEMAAAGDAAMNLQVLDLDYQEALLRVSVYGTIEAPFDQAHKGYRTFVATLEKEGYTVADQRFDTQINRSRFMLKLVRRMT